MRVQQDAPAHYAYLVDKLFRSGIKRESAEIFLFSDDASEQLRYSLARLFSAFEKGDEMNKRGI